MKTVKGIMVAISPFIIVACSVGTNNMENVPEAPDSTKGSVSVQPDRPETPNKYKIGTTFSFQKMLRDGTMTEESFAKEHGYWNIPVFDCTGNKVSDEEWWDNLAEEMSYSGIDYVAADCRGKLPDPAKYYDHGDPTRIQDLINALKRRGENHLRIAIFDDTPASWAAQRNRNLGKGYVPAPQAPETTYPIDNIDEVFYYIWDCNLKLAFENFYGVNKEANNKYLFRYNGKPLLYMWNPGPFLIDTSVPKGQDNRQFCHGRLVPIFRKIREEFRKEFGEDVFICVDNNFMKLDNQLTNKDVDAVNNWFDAHDTNPNKSNYSIRDWNNTKVGMAVPGFLTNEGKGSQQMYIDPDHGRLITQTLEKMKQCDLIFLEGMTDMAENAAFWRSSDTRFYDFPNQRLNILRKFSDRPYPKEFRIEAETCDRYNDTTPGNSGGQYRLGDLDIKRCDDLEARHFQSSRDTYGWCVTDITPGEWLEWEELPFRKGPSSISIRYKSVAQVAVRLDIDGKSGEDTTLPSTGGKWNSIVITTVTSNGNGWRKVRLNFLSGNADVNYIDIKNDN